MPKRFEGFTIVELGIAIVILVIMASLAVAAYQTYTVRAQVAEGIDFAAGAKTPIVDAYTNSGVAPANRVATGMTTLATDTRGSYVSSVAIENGRIDVTFGGPLAHQDLIGATVSLTPYVTSPDSIVWRCGFAAAPVGTLLAGGAEHLAPTVDPRYLPAACRG